MTRSSKEGSVRCRSEQSLD